MSDFDKKENGFGDSFKGQTSKTVEKSASSIASSIGDGVMEKGRKIAKENEEIVVKTVKRGVGCILITIVSAIIFLIVVVYFLYSLFK